MYRRTAAIALGTLLMAGLAPEASAADAPVPAEQAAEGSTQALLNHALDAIRFGDYAEAKGIYTEILAGSPTPEVRTRVTKALADVDQVIALQTPHEPAPAAEEATAEKPAAPALQPTPAQVSGHAPLQDALMALQSGDYAKARTIYQQVLAGNPAPEVGARVTKALAEVDALIRLEASAAAPAPAAIPQVPLEVPAASASEQPRPNEHAHEPLFSSLQPGPVSTLRPPAPATSPEAELDNLRSAMIAEPMNLDRYFAFAQKAEAEGKFKEAELTYLDMLELDPKLDRVRLELAALYIQNGQLDKAKDLLEEVSAHKPPEAVRKNVDTLLAAIKKAQQKNIVEGTASLGFNYDSNANSASSNSAISVFDQTIELPPGSQKKGDGQTFASAGLAHTYRFDPSEAVEGLQTKWYSTGTAYKANQNQLHDLNLTVYSGRTGPVFDLTEYHTTIGIAGGYNYVALGGFHYMNDVSLETDINHAFSKQFSMQLAALSEGRSFDNSAISDTFSDQSGDAWQESIGATWAPEETDVINGQLLYRRENARATWWSNSEFGASAGYTHSFPYDIFSNLSASWRDSRYDGPDPLISINTRDDKLAIFGVTLGKNFGEDLMCTVGYQYTDDNSNIQNYAYTDQRVSTSVGVKF